jgi:hypothetical protein
MIDDHECAPTPPRVTHDSETTRRVLAEDLGYLLARHHLATTPHPTPVSGAGAGRPGRDRRHGGGRAAGHRRRETT